MTDVTLTATFTTAGTFTWTCPAAVSSVVVACTGAGGGGGGCTTTSGSNGGGGGGGEAALEPAVAVTAGLSYTGTVGAGGTTGLAGGDSWFTGDGGVQVYAHGGGGGTEAAPAGSGPHGAGGGGSVNSVSAAGGDGDDGTGATNGGGGGGAAGVSVGAAFPGSDGSGSAAGAASGGTWPGAAGGAGATTGAAGSAGSAPGGGGGGALSTGTGHGGGTGGHGQVVITWTQSDPVTVAANTSGGSYAYTAPLGATAVTAQAWGAGASGFNTAASGVTGGGRAGSTVWQVYGITNKTQRVQAANIFDGYAGVPLALQAQKIYYNETGGDSIAAYQDVNNPQPVGLLAAAGCQIVLCPKANRNYGTTDDFTALQSAVADIASNIGHANLTVVLWQECTDHWFSSATDYLHYWNHYAPAIPSNVKLALDLGAGPGLATDQAYGHAIMGSTVRTPDVIAIDVYDSSYHFGRNYLTYPPSDPNYPGVADMADTLGVPFGIYEWGQSAAASYNETAANWNDYIYGTHGLLTIIQARIAAGKPMHHVMYYGGSGPGNNDINSGTDFRIPAMQDIYHAMASGTAVGGAGGGGGEFAQESSLAVVSGTSYALVVGAGGTGGTSGGNSTVAGQSVTVTAHGGSVATATTAGGTGGTGSSNATHHSGGHGGAGGGSAGGGGGGGGSGGTAAAGNVGAAGTATAGGLGGAAVTGGGKGGSGHNPGAAGGTGSVPGGGGGGGGASSLNVGAGADGQIVLSGFVTNPALAGGPALAPMAVSGSVFVGSTSGQAALGPLAVSGAVTVTGGSATVTSTGSVALAPLAVAASGSAVVPAGTVATSGSVALAPLKVQSPSLATTFGQGGNSPLPLLVEILINGVWTDITTYTYQRTGIQISSRGRPDEASTAQPAQCQITLNNRDGTFSPLNQGGQFWPYLTRNTQLRVSVQNAVTPLGASYTGYRFWGEVPAWPVAWDPTGTDVTVQITAAGVLQRMQQNKSFGSPLARYYQQFSDPTNGNPALVPAGYWTCEDASGASSFASGIQGGSPMTWTGGTPGLSGDSNIPGSNAVATTNSTAWTGATGAYSSGGITYSAPGTYQWLCPAGVTSILAECWGAGGGGSSGDNDAGSGGGGGEYAAATIAVTPGKPYTLMVGAGGSGGGGTFHTTPNSGTAGAASVFSGDTVTVKAHGGKGGSTSAGAGGTGSSNSTHHSGGHGGSTGSGFGGCGGGGSGGSSQAGNNGGSNSGTAAGAGAVQVADGGGGGAGGTGALASQGTTATPGMMPFPGPGGGGGAGGYNGSDDYGKPGGGGQAGQVRITFGQTAAPNANVLRVVADVPSGGGVEGAYLGEILTGGTIAVLHVKYHTGSGGQLQLIGKNGGGSTIIDSGTQVFGCDGQPMLISCELTQKNASTIKWKLTAVTPNATAAVATYTGTVSGTLGSVTQVNVNDNNAGIDTSSGIGHVSVQYAVDPVLNLAPALGGYGGELASVRFARLCGQQNIPFELVGADSDTPQMGIQTDQLLLALLQECETADLGLMFEPRDRFGLAYITRAQMQNPPTAATLDYSRGQLAQSLAPTDDELLTRNDITITRTNGSYFEAVLLTGAMSTADPPAGVGSYSFTNTVNLFADTQLQPYATWLLTLGTVDEFRYPVITIDLTRAAVADGTFGAVASLDIASFLQIVYPSSISDLYSNTYSDGYGTVTSQPPVWLPPTPISQLCYGFTETLNAFTWTIAVNAVPASPYLSPGGVAPPDW